MSSDIDPTHFGAEKIDALHDAGFRWDDKLDLWVNPEKRLAVSAFAVDECTVARLLEFATRFTTTFCFICMAAFLPQLPAGRVRGAGSQMTSGVQSETLSLIVSRPIATTIAIAMMLAVGSGPAARAEPEPLGSEFRINVTQGHASITGTATGFIVVWSGYLQNGPGFGIFGQRLSFDGGAINPEFQANTHTTNSQTGAHVAASADGAFVVVWNGAFQDGDGAGVFGQRYNSDGDRVGTEFQINTYTTDGQFRPNVGVARDGRFIVVWVSDGQDGSFAGVYGQRYDSDGARAGTEFRVNNFTPGNQTFPEIAVTTAGEFIVAWSGEGSTSGADTVFARRFTSLGDPMGNDLVINETGRRFSRSDPDVATDASGNFAVVWSTYLQDGSRHGVAGRRFMSNGLPAGTEFQVNTYTSGNQSDAILATDFPRVAMDDGGDFVAVWTSFRQDGSFRGVFGQTYSSDGSATGTEFQINTYTYGDQRAPAVAYGADGEFLVVWSNVAEGDGSGMVGQLFGHAPPSPTPSPTASPTTLPPPVCPPTPLPGCLRAAESVFVVKDVQGDGASVKDKLLWKWSRGAAMLQTAFGSPTTTTAYRFCVYTGSPSLLTMRAEIPPAGMCEGSPCWKLTGNRGYRRVDPAAMTAGVSRVLLFGHPTQDRSAAVVKGLGAQLDLKSGTLPLDSSADVIVQFSTDEALGCWQSAFSATETRENSDTQYRAKSR